MPAMAHLPRWLAFSLVLLGLAAQARAAPPAAQQVPPQAAPAIPPLLSPWVSWVLDAAGDARCPLVDQVRICVWPSSLSIDVAGNAASFSMRVTSDREGDVPLPGSPEHWPIDVQVDGARLPVLEPEGTPVVHVARGLHDITGRFVFGEPPTTLQVPPNVGALSLRRDGAPLAHPRREANGMIWIEESESGDEREERL
ncbi:MAG: hypothetical protein JWN48_5217, partial [Myxococcaceae bacterium]|nr:hypothetical protein [Myxococcaceae bacterium]